MYQKVADKVAVDAFSGHAHVLRHNQLDALTEAGELDAVAALTAQLVATTLHGSDMHQAQLLRYRLDKLVRDRVQQAVKNTTERAAADGPENTGRVSGATEWHASRINAAYNADMRNQLLRIWFP
jgi:hypothetical protein